MIKRYFGPHVGDPLFLSDFKGIGIFPTTFSKNIHASNFMIARPLGTDFFMQTEGRTGRHTDMTNLITPFRA
jgi:hypothetical protein